MSEMNFSDSIFVLLLFSTFRLSLPLVLTAVGGYFSEKSGVAQIGLEAFLLIGAFTASSVTYLSGSLFYGYISAALASLLMAQLFCFLVLKLRANAIVIGTGLNLFVIGLIPLIGKVLFDSTGSTPTIPTFDNTLIYPMVTLVLALGLSYYLSEKTIWGLQVKFAGEKQDALSAIGVNFDTRRWQAVSYGAFVTGLAGAILSTYLSSSYSPLMSAGRGYIALAAIIFAGWDLRRTILISLFFGFFEALQIQAQSNQAVSSLIPGEFIQMIPYLITLLALLFFKSKRQAPKELK
ncbi:MAG: ABC transporter permease [Bdellovibrio sp.]|nr:ABC transporter permease [Bdellovibrio sp.]